MHLLLNHRCRGRWLLALLPLLLVLLPGGCGRDVSSADRLPPLEKLNVLLIVIDTLGAEHLGCFDPTLHHTPRLDQLAQESVFFRRATSAAPWTQPAIASLLTGLLPSHHRVRHILDSLSPRVETMAERLQACGHRTAGVVSHTLVTGRFGFDQGCEVFDTSSVGSAAAITSARVTAVAGDLLAQMAGDRFFMLVHYFDPHGLYNHHPEFDLTSRYRGPLRPAMPIRELRDRRWQMTPADIHYLVGLYHEEIAYTDHQVGLLLDRLQELGLADDTLVILTADHGEEFMRHGWIGHTITLYDELLHVPLLFRLPGRLQPHTVDTPVSLLDVLPTLLDLSASRVEGDPLDGQSLLDLLLADATEETSGREAQGAAAGKPGTAGEPGKEPKEASRDLLAEVSFVAPQGWPVEADAERLAVKTAVLRWPWKLIHDLPSDRWELYDRGEDPQELHDLATAGRPIMPQLQQKLRDWEATRPRDALASRAMSAQGGAADSALAGPGEPDSTASPPAAGDSLPAIDPATVRQLRALGYVD
jgi:arylsulfatase A-like enzyme